MLAAALSPCVAAVARAAARGWMPIGDAAYFTVRSADLFTAHRPLVGAWSSGSSVLGEDVNNVGPLQLDVLALFTNAPFGIVSPYLGTGIASALINALAITAVWVAARSFLGPRRVAVVMVATLLLIATLGVPWLLDARQQLAMVLPFYALCWVMTAVTGGTLRLLPVAVAISSLIVQTHFTYAAPVAIVAGVGAVVVVVRWTRRRTATDRASVRRSLLWSVVVAVVCWIQPLIDQFAGTGNLGRVLGSAGTARRGAGFHDGIQVVAGSTLTPPFWFVGSVADFLTPSDGVRYGAAIATVAIWMVAAATVVVIAGRAGEWAAVVLGGGATVVLVAAVVAASTIPRSLFGLVPQNYYWMWAVGAYVSTALIVGCATLLAARDRSPNGDIGARRTRTALGAVLVAAVVATWPRYAIDTIGRDEATAERVGPSLREQLAESFADPSFPTVVEIAPIQQFGNQFIYVVLVELQRADVEFRFRPGNTNLHRFGRSRCAPAGRYPVVRHIVGSSEHEVPGAETLAAVSFAPSDQADESQLVVLEPAAPAVGGAACE